MSRASDAATLVRVSRLYYELGETQDEIARSLGVTRPQVSKLLKRARSEGIVEIRIVDRADRPGEVADELRTCFSLDAVHLAPTFEGSEERTRRRVAQIAAQVLTSVVRDGMVVGIGDGAAVGAMADVLEPLPTAVNATVVPLCGGFWGGTAGHEPFRRVADALGAVAHGLLAPGLLDDALTRDALANHRGIRAIADLWTRLDVAVYGIGAATWSAGAVGEVAFEEIERGDAVGEVLIAPLDVDGRFVSEELRRRTIAFDARALRHVAIPIAVASGPEKHLPVLGALRAGIVGTLVTDVDTATAVLDLDRSMPRRAAGDRG